MEGILQSPRQIVRAAVSFLIVVVAFWLYSLLAVPFIEPVAVERTKVPSAGGGNPSAKPMSRHDRLIRDAFPDENAWQRQRPKVVETDQAVLLVQVYRTLDDGRMELKPCTVLFRPKRQRDAQGNAKGGHHRYPGRILGVVSVDQADGGDGRGTSNGHGPRKPAEDARGPLGKYREGGEAHQNKTRSIRSNRHHSFPRPPRRPRPT